MDRQIRVLNGEGANLLTIKVDQMYDKECGVNKYLVTTSNKNKIHTVIH